MLKLDQRTIAEIKSFANPPEPIYHVMKGVLILLGNTKKEMKVSLIFCWGPEVPAQV